MEEVYLSLDDLEFVHQELLQFLFGYLQDDKGVHVETAIVAASSLAGVTLLRSCVPANTLAELAPGSLILHDEVNERGLELIQAIGSLCQSLGIASENGWNETIPAEHQSNKPVAELVRDLEMPFQQVATRLNLHPAVWSHVAAYTALKLVKLGETILPTDIGKSLILSSIIAASKIVPDRSESRA